MVSSRQVAREKGAFAAHPAAVELWRLSKREILEVALRLSKHDDPSLAVDAFINEYEILKGAGIV